MGWQDRKYHGETSDHDLFPRAHGWTVIIWLIVINTVVFFIDGFTARAMNGSGFGGFGGGLLTKWGSFSAATALFQGQVWRFITFQFLHGGIGHILFNMIALFFLGRFVESFLGPRRFLAFYLLSGCGGALSYLLLWLAGMWAGSDRVPFVLIHDAATPIVGASAGVYGIMVAAVVIAPNMRVRLWLPPIEVPLKVVVLVLLLVALYMVMTSGDGGQAGHLGGALFGWLLIKQPQMLNWSDDFGAVMARWKLQRQRRTKQREVAAQDRSDAEVDRILAKVKEKGLQSLSSREKRTLQQATDRQRSG